MEQQKKTFDKEDLKKRLTDIQYSVTQLKDTERPFTGQYWDSKDDGIYDCIVCGEKLFVYKSDTKFDSGCGWPSFFKCEEGKVKEEVDKSHGMVRTEVLCNACGAHLGHVFTDGPKPTRLRYCINSASINFRKKE